MVMRPDPRMGALTRVRRRNLGTWWLWSLVVILAVVGGYAGYIARFSNARLSDSEAARLALAADNDALKSGVAGLRRQIAEATVRADKAQSDAEAVSALLAKQQKRLADLQTELSSAREETGASKKEADDLRAKAQSAEAAFEQVRKLQDRVTALKSEVDAGKSTIERLTAEAAAAATQRSALEREIASLKNELSEVQKKLEAAMTAASAQPATP